MDRFRKMAIVCLLTFSLLFTCIRPISFQGESISYSYGPELDEPFSISSDSPIVITSDADFTIQGWQGNGSMSSPFIIENQTISSSQTCISISDTLSYFVVCNCTLTSLAVDTNVIELNNVRNGAIISNNITFNLIGIDFLSCGSSKIKNNTLQRPDISYQDGVHAIRLYDSDFVEISSNFITSRPNTGGSSDNRGILLNLSIECTVDGNYINSFMGRGIYFESSSYCNMTNNLIDDCMSGYYLRASNDCYVENNVATRTTMGFGVWVGLNHILVGNRAENLLDEGYIIANSYDCQLIGNTARNIPDYENGIELIYGAANNTLYGNFILCDNVLDDGSNNDWDNGVDLGNYWSSYSGIGTYPIPGTSGSVDRFPRYFGTPAINLVSIRDFEFGFESRVLNWTYSGQAPISYKLEKLNEFQMYQIESEGLWNESQTSLSLYLEPTDVGEYLYRFTVFYEIGFSLTDELIVNILPASGPHIGYVIVDSYPTPDNDIEVRADVNDISGVSEVTLSFSTYGDVLWRNIPMSRNQTELWTAMIPGQPNDTILYMKVYANDTLGNLAVTELIVRLVTDSPPVTSTGPTRPSDEENKWLTALLMGGIMVEISIIIFILWNRRKE